MKEFLVPILTLTGLGLFFGLVLTLASKKFAVVQDQRIEEILEKLPGANCGACGLAGCARFAEGLVKKEASLDNCKACAPEAASEIANILGIEVAVSEKEVATLRCHGGKEAKEKFVYQGIKDCQLAAQVLGGQKLCSFACLGFGNCERECPFGAIRMNFAGLPIIDSQLCTGCGKCIEACPRNLIVLIPAQGKVYVGCNSHQPAKIVTRVCEVGCIACRACEKVCQSDAIHVVDNLAAIDYTKCTSCAECVKACPRKIIKTQK